MHGRGKEEEYITPETVSLRSERRGDSSLSVPCRTEKLLRGTREGGFAALVQN